MTTAITGTSGIWAKGSAEVTPSMRSLPPSTWGSAADGAMKPASISPPMIEVVTSA